MRLNPRLKTVGSLGLFISTLLMLTFLEACNRFDKDDANGQAQTKKGPAAPISVENGQTVLTLDTSRTSQLFAMAMLRHRRSFKNHASKQTLPVRSTRA